MFLGSSFKTNWYLWCLISFALVSCRDAKYTQCQQIIELANQVNHQTQEVINRSSEPIESQIWLQTATMMEQAAESTHGLGGALAWPALLRKLNRLDASYRD